MGLLDFIKNLLNGLSSISSASSTSAASNDLKPEERALLSQIARINASGGSLSPELYNQMREFEAQWLDRTYDLNSIEGIDNIPLRKDLRCPYTAGVTGKLYYYLRKKPASMKKPEISI